MKSIKYAKVTTIVFMMSLIVTGLQAQTVSGDWDAANITANTGYANHGNGVIQLLSNVSNGCQGAAVHEISAKHNVNNNFSKCYKVFFGCPGNDQIGNATDENGDGLAFSFWNGTATYSVNNGACGGGLGYNGGASDNKMITIEFDTYSSMGTAGFDGSYGGGTTGNHDEIAVHFGGIALDANRLTSVDAGNLEDGLEHTICINYNATNHRLGVSIDGTSKLSYDLGSTYNLATYFGSSATLNQTWSSGKFGAKNPATVNDDVTSIAAQLGGSPLCPANLAITSPSNGSEFDVCDGAITITASATPPASNTISSIEFFVDGLSIGSDNNSPYSAKWNTPTEGSHSINAVAQFSPSNTGSTSGANTISVISLKDCTPPEPVAIVIPNLITPNNDQKNDHFEILSLPANSSLKVFNRWGDRVYQSSNYDNLWAGNNTSDGVYYYDLILPDGRRYKGWLNIIR